MSRYKSALGQFFVGRYNTTNGNFVRFVFEIPGGVEVFKSAKCGSALTRRFEAMSWRVRSGSALAFLALSLAAQASVSPCDLNKDGVINTADVQLAINMTLGSVPCTASIDGAGVCNAAIVQRVINAARGGPCVTGPGAVAHYVSLSWAPSLSLDVAGYNVYRGTKSGGPYTIVNASLVVGTTFTDKTVVAGQTYYYVSAAVNDKNMQSPYSSQVSATVPSP